MGHAERPFLKRCRVWSSSVAELAFKDALQPERLLMEATELAARASLGITWCCRYMPAELLMEGKMTKAADVYSFAMLMHELLTGQQLFEGMRQSQVSFSDDLIRYSVGLLQPSEGAYMLRCWRQALTHCSCTLNRRNPACFCSCLQGAGWKCEPLCELAL